MARSYTINNTLSITRSQHTKQDCYLMVNDAFKKQTKATEFCFGFSLDIFIKTLLFRFPRVVYMDTLKCSANQSMYVLVIIPQFLSRAFHTLLFTRGLKLTRKQ